jgi:hypothetical protein
MKLKKYILNKTSIKKMKIIENKNKNKIFYKYKINSNKIIKSNLKG